jgi:hypothetical protein
MIRSGQESLPLSGETPLVTTCGRQVAVKRLLLALPERPVTRVTLDVGPVVHGEPGLWASLTVDEARDLARRLLAQAALADTAARTDK